MEDLTGKSEIWGTELENYIQKGKSEINRRGKRMRK